MDNVLIDLKENDLVDGEVRNETFVLDSTKNIVITKKGDRIIISLENKENGQN